MEHEEKPLPAWHQKFAGKWFLPILQALDDFEKLRTGVFPEIDAAVADEAPEWIFQSLWKIAEPAAKHTGLTNDPQKIDARTIGKMVGCTWAICDLYARAYPFWSQCPPQHAKKWEEVFGEGFLVEAIALSLRFREEITPAFRKVKRDAFELAEQSGGFEEVALLQGFTQGEKHTHDAFAKFWKILAKQIKPSKNKRQKDAEVRMLVYGFVIFVAGFEIEKEKKNLSWPELYEAFLEFTEYKCEIDEETFKKILQRTGLGGVGSKGVSLSNKSR